MKKLVATSLALVLTFGCTTAAYAVDDATRDEAKKVESIELTKLPDKLKYEFPTEAGWKIDGKNILDLMTYDDISFDEIYQYARQAEFTIDIDMTGSEITAAYTDGSTAVIDSADCTISVADLPNMTEFLDKMSWLDSYLDSIDGIEDIDDMSEEELNAYLEVIERALAELRSIFFREYTVNVAYSGAQASFKVEVTVPDFDRGGDDYEFVSLEDSNPKTYYLSKDFEAEEFGDDVIGYYLNFDTSNLKVTARNTETGETVTLSGDQISLYFSYYSDEEVPQTGTYTAQGLAYDFENDCYVEFEYEFKLVNDLKPAPSKDASSTTATKDEAKAATSDSVNGTVKTGQPFAFAAIAATLLGIAAVCAVYFKRRENS